jgi:hypothetical protein
MDWIKKYRFKTLEELEPYIDGDHYTYNGYGFIEPMYEYCGLPLSDFVGHVNCSEIEFKENGYAINNGNWYITYFMVIDIVGIRKEKLKKLDIL